MCTFIHKLARGKLQQHKLTLPTKELSTIITSFLPIGFAPQRSFVAFLFFVVFCNDKQHCNDYQYRSHMFTPYLIIVL